jgi:hypothetical protein
VNDITGALDDLAEYRGATVTLWGYSASLRTLTLRLQRVGDDSNLHIVCRGCSRVELAPHWLNSDLIITQPSVELILISDTRAAARIECSAVHTHRNVPPIYKPV